MGSKREEAIRKRDEFLESWRNGMDQKMDPRRHPRRGASIYISIPPTPEEVYEEQEKIQMGVPLDGGGASPGI